MLTHFIFILPELKHNFFLEIIMNPGSTNQMMRSYTGPMQSSIPSNTAGKVLS